MTSDISLIDTGSLTMTVFSTDEDSQGAGDSQWKTHYFS